VKINEHRQQPNETLKRFKQKHPTYFRDYMRKSRIEKREIEKQKRIERIKQLFAELKDPNFEA